jgi:DNA-binding NarL/FixJ family response regulator
MANGPIRVAIVEDDKGIRELMGSTLQRERDIRLVRTFPNADDFQEAFPAMEFDVVVMDINMPGTNGIEAIRATKPLRPTTQFLVVTVFENPTYIFQALCAGATGYLVKDAESDVLVAAVREISAGGSPMSPSIARMVVNSMHGQAAGAMQEELLTLREREVLDALANGLMYKQIAGKLVISVGTVQNHVRHIYEKLQVHSRAEAVRRVFPDRPFSDG